MKKIQPTKNYSRRNRLKSADDSDDLDGVPNLVTLTYLELNALNDWLSFGASRIINDRSRNDKAVIDSGH